MTMHKIRVIDGTQFETPVIPSGPIEPREPVEPKELTDQYMVALASLGHERDLLTPDDERELHELVLERMTSNKRSIALLERARAISRERILAAHEEIKEQVRQHQQKMTDHRDGVQKTQGELNRMVDRRGAALADLRAAEVRLHALGRFAAKKEREAALAHLAECSKKVDVLNGKVADLQSRINQANLVDMKPLVEKLNELTTEEAKLAHFVTGQSYTNELGIVVPPCRPI